jgi:hypothetical protein
VVKRRCGAGRLGCLLGILLLVTAIYFGANIGEVYVRSFRLRDAMEQEARFAHQRDDNTIRSRLVAYVDSIGLPEAAARFRIDRTAGTIVIATDYTEHVELPLLVREFRFTPRVERRF